MLTNFLVDNPLNPDLGQNLDVSSWTFTDVLFPVMLAVLLIGIVYLAFIAKNGMKSSAKMSDSEARASAEGKQGLIMTGVAAVGFVAILLVGFGIFNWIF